MNSTTTAPTRPRLGRSGARPPRKLLAAFTAALAAALCCTALVGASPAAASQGQELGIQTHLLWGGVSQQDVRDQLDLTARSGAGIIRLDVGWSTLQPDGPGQWSQWALDRLDYVIDQADQRGVKVLVTFWRSPCWASSAPASVKQGCEGHWWDRQVDLWGPKDPKDYANALDFVIRRYGDRVAAWEIWSEPNSTDAYRTPRPTAVSYARLTRVAYDHAKATDPNTTIVAGATMWSDQKFTRALYRHGIKNHFDAYSIHPYSDDRSPLDHGDRGWANVSFVRGVPKVRRVMVNHGDAKPLWLTEFGWSTTTTRDSSNWLNGVTESTQADFIQQALDQVKQWDYVDSVFYYDLMDMSTDESSTLDNFGLVHYDGDPKPAFSAFKSASQKFR